MLTRREQLGLGVKVLAGNGDGEVGKKIQPEA